MNFLIINVNNASVEGLEQFAPKHSITSKTATETLNSSPEVLNDFDGIVVAGSYAASVDNRQAQLALLLGASTKPVIGIGRGFETICQMLGIDLDNIGELAEASPRMIPTDDGTKLFQGTDPLLVSESKRWLVEELPKSCQILARSADGGVEAFRHKKLPLTALQLLPQDFTYPSDAKMVYANLLAIFGK